MDSPARPTQSPAKARARPKRHTAHVAIIGAGPAGTAAALRLAQNGVDDVVLLDATDFPRDKTCGSALSPRCIALAKELGIWEGIEDLAYPITGIRIVTPGGQDVYLSGGTDLQAAICLRRDLDYEILKRALDLGVEFVSDFRASEPIMNGNRWAGVRAKDGREVHAPYVIVANGAHSKFVVTQHPKRYIHTIMGWWADVDFCPGHVEMLFDRMFEPMYGWLFPEAENRVNIGITYDDPDKSINPRELFRRFIGKYYAERLEDATQIGQLKGHPILFSYRIGKLYSPGRIIIGEAGRMTHPATGEGIYQGIQSGVFAADALRDILIRAQSERVAVMTYEARCLRRFLPSFWAGGLFRHAVRTPLMDWLVRFGSLPGVQNSVARILAKI